MIKQTTFLGVIALILAIAIGCQTRNNDPTPIFITEVFIFDDGQEIILTWEATATPAVEIPTPQPTIPIPDSIVQLDLATTDRLGDLDPQIAHNEITATVIDNLYVGLTRIDAETD
ncbi:MAG TPA: hypothetical protein ENJ56_03840, partial [Anaerolineae bacterium]|nr:hypothetical protein [Anaerolineae bacterium]